MKLIDILNEVRAMQTGMIIPFPQHLLPHFDKIMDNFGGGNSGFELNEPITEEYELSIEDDDFGGPAEEALLNGLNGKGKQKYYIENYWGVNTPTDAPSDAFYALIEFNPDNDNNFIVSCPYVNENERYVGWFNSKGEYVPTTTMDENGDEIN